jgi:hypothetical protein
MNGKVLNTSRPDDIYFSINNLTQENYNGVPFFVLNLGQNLSIYDQSELYISINNWNVSFTSPNNYSLLSLYIASPNVDLNPYFSIPILDVGYQYAVNAQDLININQMTTKPKYYRVIQSRAEYRPLGKNMNQIFLGIYISAVTANTNPPVYILPQNITSFSGEIKFSKNYQNYELDSQRPARLRGERRIINLK